MEDPNLKMRQTGVDYDYLKSVPGILKIAEIVCNLHTSVYILKLWVKWSI